MDNSARKRVRIACGNCRSRKLRCNAAEPCANCRASDSDCQYYPATESSVAALNRQSQTGNPREDALCDPVNEITALEDENLDSQSLSATIQTSAVDTCLSIEAMIDPFQTVDQNASVPFPELDSQAHPSVPMIHNATYSPTTAIDLHDHGSCPLPDIDSGTVDDSWQVPFMGCIMEPML